MHEPPEDDFSFQFPRDSFAENQKLYCADIYAVIGLVDRTEKTRMKLTPQSTNSELSEIIELEESDLSGTVRFTPIAASYSGPTALTLLEFSRFALRNI